MTVLRDDQGIAFAEGALPAFDAMSRILGVRNGSLSSILARQDVQRLFYTVNGTANHLAIGIQNFPGAVTTGQMTLVTVDDASPLLRISNVVDFSSSQQAQAQLGYFRSVYLGSEEFVSYDEFLQALATQPVGSLQKAVALVG